MIEKIVQRRLVIPDNKVDEARRDYEMQTDPRNLITFNDGYHERSIREKWGMSSSELGEVLKGAPKRRRSIVRARP
jgi:hypothetical protein